MVTESLVTLLQFPNVEGASHLKQGVSIDLICLSIVAHLVAEEISNFRYSLWLLEPKSVCIGDVHQM